MVVRHWPAVTMGIAAFTWAAAAAAQQATSLDLQAGIRACAAINGDDASRLSCFDELAASLATQPQAPAVVVDGARVEALQRESFGFNLPNLARLLPELRGAGASDLTSIEIQLDRIIDHHDGSYSFVMADGQRWIQTTPQGVHNLRGGDTVTIRRGMLGAYMLVSPRGGAPHSVRRER